MVDVTGTGKGTAGDRGRGVGSGGRDWEADRAGGKAVSGAGLTSAPTVGEASHWNQSKLTLWLVGMPTWSLVACRPRHHQHWLVLSRLMCGQLTMLWWPCAFLFLFFAHRVQSFPVYFEFVLSHVWLNWLGSTGFFKLAIQPVWRG